MNRMRNVSWWGAVMLGGLLLALPAVAAGTSPEQCKGQCVSKANEAMDACVQSCPRAAGDPGKDNNLRACVSRCSKKLQSSMESCNKTCPSGKRDQTH